MALSTDASPTEVRELIRAYYEGLFPKSCPHCGRGYATLREYVAATTPVGRYISYDVDVGDFAPERPAGTFAFANCACGNTLALSTEGLPRETRLALLAWVRAEAARQGLPATQFIDWLRKTVRDDALGQTAPPPA
ncbi:MAG: hypothetical protein AB7O28_03995 [Vicinamibacterales bacterium]